MKEEKKGEKPGRVEAGAVRETQAHPCPANPGEPGGSGSAPCPLIGAAPEWSVKSLVCCCCFKMMMMMIIIILI